MWDIKHLIRTIVLSETYRQTSQVTPQLAERDPDNRLLARQSRYRVEAEAVRDSVLAISGLLVEKFGGPSVKPYQPDGYIATLNFPRREYSASAAGNDSSASTRAPAALPPVSGISSKGRSADAIQPSIPSNVRTLSPNFV